ncbi:unannotated protein [freshwater metagenome]|uniref:Unannotated protein n=1 Tax=freshwater metagenome TaxID=449393 RepID=A0A6J7F2I2_9ZZZZ
MGRRNFLIGAGTLASTTVAWAVSAGVPGASAIRSPKQGKPNLVVNPSFELDGMGTTITGWTLVR